MRAVVLYESLFGNTEAVARAVAEGLAPVGEVTLARFGEVPRGAVEEADLVVLGGPTHGWGMTKPASRQRPGGEGYAVGAREWLEGSPQATGKLAAAFDTRFAKPRWLTGSPRCASPGGSGGAVFGSSFPPRAASCSTPRARFGTGKRIGQEPGERSSPGGPCDEPPGTTAGGRVLPPALDADSITVRGGGSDERAALQSSRLWPQMRRERSQRTSTCSKSTRGSCDRTLYIVCASSPRHRPSDVCSSPVRASVHAKDWDPRISPRGSALHGGASPASGYP